MFNYSRCQNHPILSVLPTIDSNSLGRALRLAEKLADAAHCVEYRTFQTREPIHTRRADCTFNIRVGLPPPRTHLGIGVEGGMVKFDQPPVSGRLQQEVIGTVENSQARRVDMVARKNFECRAGIAKYSPNNSGLDRLRSTLVMCKFGTMCSTENIYTCSITHRIYDSI